MTGAAELPVVPTVRLSRDANGPYAELDWLGERTRRISDPDLDVLQAMFRHDEPRHGFESLESHDVRLPSSLAIDARLVAARAEIAAGRARIVIGADMFSVVPVGRLSDSSSPLPLDVRGIARRHGMLLRWLAGENPDSKARLDQCTFDDICRGLIADGLLVQAPGRLGESLPKRPYCQLFGMQRGTPIDRHYLMRFVDESIRAVDPAGRVLDIGGTFTDRLTYRLRGVREYDTLDLDGGPGVTIVGDAEETTAVEAGSVDTALVFNVLEHSRHPQLLVDNIRRWLRPGGRCLAMVPAAQRLHAFPVDWGRFSPQSFAKLFEGFATAELHVYGNLAASLGSLAGLAAEEFEPETLEEYLPDYPVAICIRACA